MQHSETSDTSRVGVLNGGSVFTAGARSEVPVGTRAPKP